MYHHFCATFLLFVITVFSATAHFIPDYTSSQYDDRSLEKLHHHQDSSGNDNFCHGSHAKGGEKYFDDLIKINQLEGLKNTPDYPLQYSDEDDSRERSNTLDVRPRWPKRSQSLQPFISLGALSNLPAFFEQLRGTMDKLEEQQSQQAQLQAAAAAAAQAAEAERSFRPPATAAVLHAFRNYRPLRRTRSFPPALVHG